MATTNSAFPIDGRQDETLDRSRSPRAEAVQHLLRLVVKAQKARRLYDKHNTVSERLETELFDRLSDFLSRHGEVALVVLEFQLKCANEIVYDSQERNDSLAFLLYRDGIRRLSFHPGLEREELRSFLECLNRVAQLTNEQDDLVTLFWEQEFYSIRYFAIEELSDTHAYPRLEDQLKTGELDCGEAEGAPGVSLDLDQPVSTVPVEGCRLSDDELEALRAELASEENLAFQHLVIELAIELTLLEEDEAERAELMRSLVAIADGLVDDGALAELVTMEEHLDGLAKMVFAADASVQNLADTFVDHLREPDRIEQFLTKVNEHGAPKPEALTSYLARLGECVVPMLLPWIGRLTSSAYRRAVTEVLLSMEDGGLHVIEANLPLDAPGVTREEQLEHRQFVREILHALSRFPGEKALPPLTRLLGAFDRGTRRETFVSISRYPDESIDDLSLAHLQDADPEIRATALDTIVRRGRAELGEKLLERSLAAGELGEYGLIEKRRIFAAAAKLCGESVLDVLGRLLEGKEDRWFTPKREKELAEAVAHGIRIVGTEKAREMLTQFTETGARFVRAACEKELSQ